MLSDSEVIKIRQALCEAKRPLFFFHDDPDGFASFVMCYHEVSAGKGFVVKAAPRIHDFHLKKVNDYNPDVVFVLDIAVVEQDFLDNVKVPVYWIDHHTPLKRENVHYFNPQVTTGDNIPTPALIYQVTKKDLWLATIGCIGDWYLPEFSKDFKKEFPDLLPEEICKVETAYFDSPLTPIIKALSFNLKGSSQEIIKSIKTLIKIKSPYEILNRTTSKGRLIWKRYEKLNSEYNLLLKLALASRDENDPILLYTYKDDKMSLTKDVANELVYRNPDKLVLLGRRKSGEVKLSLRGPKYNIPKILEIALQSVRGGGGGHEHACGAHIAEDDFELFVQILRDNLNNNMS